MFLTLSKIRNSGIAAVFGYLSLIEKWGTGIPRVIEECMEYGLKEPAFEDDGDFKVIIYRGKVNQTNQTNQVNQANQTNQAIQANQTNQAIQAIQAIQANQTDQTNQAIQAIQANQTDQTNQAIQANQANQTNQTDTNSFTGKNRRMEVSDEWFQNLRLEEQQLIKVLIKEPKITQKRVAELLSWNISTVKYYIRKLIKKGIIQREGTSQKGFWKLLRQIC